MDFLLKKNTEIIAKVDARNLPVSFHNFHWSGVTLVMQAMYDLDRTTEPPVQFQPRNRQAWDSRAYLDLPYQVN